MYQPNAPETIGGVLDAGFKLFPGALRVGFLLAVLGSLFSAIPAAVQVPLAASGGLSPGDWVLLGALYVLAIAGTCVCTAALIARVDAIANGRELGFGQSLLLGVRRGPAFFVSLFLWLLAMVVGLVLLIIPGIVVGVWFAFGYLTVVVERHGPLQSLAYSKTLTRGQWWRTFVVLTTAAVIIFVPIYTVLVTLVAVVAAWLAASADMLEQLASGTMPWYFNLVLGPLFGGLASPLLYAMSLAVYYDLRLRREGGDLVARVAAATSPAGAASTA